MVWMVVCAAGELCAMSRMAGIFPFSFSLAPCTSRPGVLFTFLLFWQGGSTYRLNEVRRSWQNLFLLAVFPIFEGEYAVWMPFGLGETWR